MDPGRRGWRVDGGDRVHPDEGQQDDIAKGLACTTEVVCVSFNAKEFGMISYLRDSAVVTSFLVGHPYDTRRGREPHLLDIAFPGRTSPPLSTC